MAARALWKREKHLRVAHEHQEAGYRLGRWINAQRRVHKAGSMESGRYRRLEALGMVWDEQEAAFEENLAAARVWYAEHRTLAAPRGAVALGKAVGQWLSNCRRPGAPDGYPRRATALAAVDPDWNPAWQRHRAGVTVCLDDGAGLADLLPGVTVDGDDIGRRLKRQRQPVTWQDLLPGQHDRPTRLGIHPHPAPEHQDAAAARARVWQGRGTRRRWASRPRQELAGRARRRTGRPARC
ncbi:helicase associated domain-containing protein [Kitasatospora sp. NPDC094015]|uniref:helicase associated domain-containing protein n=1 Tax=Kitasatospora sp. NPDC094015 TaxID=3155205 RepID=UPI0033336DFE